MRSRPTRIASFALLGVVATACTGQQPTASPAQPSIAIATPKPAASATAFPVRSGPQPSDVGCAAIIANQLKPGPVATLAPPPQPALSDGNAASDAAIRRAVDALGQLQSYRFETDIVGRDLQTLQGTTFDIVMRGTIDQADGLAVDGIVGSLLREGNGSGAVGSGAIPLKMHGDVLWVTDNLSGDLEPTPDPSTVLGFRLFTPEGAAGRFVVPFAAGYRRVGPERHGGVAATHYEATTKGLSAYKTILQFKGPITADLWIADDGDYLVGARITGKASHVDPDTNLKVDDGFLLAIDVTRANDPANVVALPALPVPDPVRPGVAPVDLQITYRLVPVGGTQPTAADLDPIGVSLRQRLDISSRPIKVDTLGQDRIVVTVCGTTHPDADRALIASHGGLSAVALPKDRFGTATSPGPETLPVAGSTIDPRLTTIAGPSRAGLTTAHVDPTTGQRGLAVSLDNPSTDKVRAYAASHRGEFVALCLDDKVLASLPIDERTANGDFVFTGDYTEAESKALARSLYSDPIPFDLRPIEDIEIPAVGG